MTLVDFLGPGSNIFPGMSGKESDWSEGQLLRNTNHIDRMKALKIPRYDYSLCLTFSTECICQNRYESATDNQRASCYY